MKEWNWVLFLAKFIPYYTATFTLSFNKVSMSLARCRYLRVILQPIAVLGGRKGGPISGVSLEMGYLLLVVSDTTVARKRLGFVRCATIGTMHHVWPHIVSVSTDMHKRKSAKTIIISPQAPRIEISKPLLFRSALLYTVLLGLCSISLGRSFLVRKCTPTLVLSLVHRQSLFSFRLA